MTKERARAKAELYTQWAQAAENQSKALYDGFKSQYKDFDWTQPILLGHHSQRRHEKVFERRDSMMRKVHELDAKAKSHRSKAENLLAFANRNKGDAEAKREEQRALADKQVSVGSQVFDFCFGNGIVERVNKKTYTIRFPSGSKFTRDKSYIRI